LGAEQEMAVRRLERVGDETAGVRRDVGVSRFPGAPEKPGRCCGDVDIVLG